LRDDMAERDVAWQIALALEVLRPERISVNPDCG
jgi:methionine synthase II (cobalamin-independent)